MRMVPGSEPTYWCETDTPVGRLLLAGDGHALRRVHFQSGPHPMRPTPEWRAYAAPFAPALAQLNEYFSGGPPPSNRPLAPKAPRSHLRSWGRPKATPKG